MGKLILSFILIVGINIAVFADSNYDRTIEVLEDKTRNDKVLEVFKEMLVLYQDEDAKGFLDHVSEDRFLQDYLTFSDAIYQDTREYDILEINYWINEIVPKGNFMRYVNVRWERYAIHNDTAQSFTKRGVSRFLFDDVSGDYKLIELAGNNLWGDTLPEWVEEVPTIPGQELEQVRLPDLSVAIKNVVNDGVEAAVEIEIKNGGDISSALPFEWSTECNDGSSYSVVFQGTIGVDESVTDNMKFKSDGACNSLTVTVDSGEEVKEKDEQNNIATITQIDKVDIGVDVLSATFIGSEVKAQLEFSNGFQARNKRDVMFDNTLEYTAECDDGTIYRDQYDGVIDAGGSVKVDIDFEAKSCNELTVVVDPNEKIDESNEENNEITFAVDVQDVDLRVTLISAIEDLSGDVTTRFRITNVGKDTLETPFEWMIECNSYQVAREDFDYTLRAGSYKEITADFDNSGKNCDEIQITVDSADAISETDEDNNEDVMKITKTDPKPDLTIEIVDIVSGQDVEVEINNIGSATAVIPSYIYWTITCEESANSVEEQYKGSEILAGETVSTIGSLTYACTSGDIVVEVDTHNGINELNEYNNDDRQTAY